MGNFTDITNNRFDRLTAISYKSKLTDCGRKKIHWICQCDCGNKIEVEASNLKSGNTTSCGCSRLGNTSGVTHGMYKTRTYCIYRSMKNRCYNKKEKSYERYGKRGITICDYWHNFSNFFKDMGKCPSNMTIERINNNLGYSKQNCKWATHKEQGNNKRSNILITHKGKTLTLSQWADRSHVCYQTFVSRVRRMGWSMERALSKH